MSKNNPVTMLKMITIMIIFINLGFCKPTESDTSTKNSSIHLWLHKPAREYNDHYFCKAEEIQGTRYLTEFATTYNHGTDHKVLLYACERPAVAVENLVWACGRMTSPISDENFDDAHKHICDPSGEEMILYATGDEHGKEGTPFKLPNDVSFEVGERTKFAYLVLQVFYGHSLFYFEGVSVDQPGVSYLYEREPTKFTAGMMLLMSAGSIPPDTHVPQDENVLDIVCDPVTMPRHKTVTAFAYRVHTHSRGLLVSGYRLRDVFVNHVWTQIGSKSPQEEQRFYSIQYPFDIEPQDYVIARCQYSNPSEETISTGPGAEREMCNLFIMHYSERDNKETPFEENFCISFGFTTLSGMTDTLGIIPQWVKDESVIKTPATNDS